MLKKIWSADDRMLRKIFIIIFSSIAILVFVTFGLWHIFYMNFALGVFELSAGIIFILNFYFLWVKNTVEASAKLVVFGVMLVSYAVFITGGVENTGNLWIILVPLFPLLLLPHKQGLRWLYIYTFILILIMLLGIFELLTLSFTPIELRQTLIVYLLFCIMLYYNELTKYIIRKSLEQSLIDLKEKDQQLIQQARLAQMGEMIAMIAHQWRQPLSAISAVSYALKLKALVGKVDKEMIIKQSDNISEYSQHLSATIDDFRNFFRPNKEKQETSYDELTKSVLTIIATSIENKNISIYKELSSQARFNTYANELRQVILNLIKNAEDILIEREIEDPYIKILSYDKEGTSILEISDNGGGIAEEIIDKIFDPYFSTKDNMNGTGLGLYMSKTIVEEHCQGKLKVQNITNAQGALVGALFRIVLKESL